jgi:crossover junction endodeoxyribonuclease RuvC
MIHIGIDPGAVSGAWAAIKDGQLIALHELPVSGVGTNKMVDAVLLADQIGGFIEREGPGTYNVFALVEKVGSFPGQGISSAFRFGRGVGIIDGVLGGLNIPTEYETPAKWKAHFRLPADKEAARQLAIRTWPDIAPLAFRRKADVDKAEAALIALYAHNRLARLAGEPEL